MAVYGYRCWRDIAAASRWRTYIRYCGKSIRRIWAEKFFRKSRNHSEAILQGNIIVRTKCMRLIVLLYMSAGLQKKNSGQG